MTWSGRRQIFIAGLVAAFIVFLAFLVLFPILHKAPTCFDNKQNGTEVGIDCGGNCANFCSSQIEPLIVRWSRAFNITGSTYSLMAYVENQNGSAILNNIPYEFRVYDNENKFLAMRQGSTYVPPNGPFAIFEPGINLGNRLPARVVFKFLDENPKWVKADENKLGKILLTTSDVAVEDTDSTPRVTAKLTNNTTWNIENVDVYVILYDSDDNAIAVSKTLKSVIAKNSVNDLLFTWPKPFDRTVVRNEILTKWKETDATLRQ